MRIVKRISLIAPVLAISACGTTYVKPAPDKPIAYLSFEAKGDATMGFAARLYLPTARGNVEHPDYQVAAQIVEGNPLLKTDNPAEIPVVANRTMKVKARFTPANVLGQYGCDNEVEMNPQANAHYKISINWARQMNCVTSIYKNVDGAWVSE